MWALDINLKSAEAASLTKTGIGKYLKEISYPKLTDFSEFMTVQNSLWEIKVDHQTPTANWFERKIIYDCQAFQNLQT